MVSSIRDAFSLLVSISIGMVIVCPPVPKTVSSKFIVTFLPYATSSISTYPFIIAFINIA